MPPIKVSEDKGSLSVQGLQELWLWVLALPEVEGKFLSLTGGVITTVN